MVYGSFFINGHAGRILVDTKEQRKSLSCGNQENTSTDDHHDRLLDNLLTVYKQLIINI